MKPRKRKRVQSSPEVPADGNEPQDSSEQEDESDSQEPEQRRKEYFCPFSAARDGATTLCKWPPHLDKRSVTPPNGLSTDSLVARNTFAKNPIDRRHR